MTLSTSSSARESEAGPSSTLFAPLSLSITGLTDSAFGQNEIKASHQTIGAGFNLDDPSMAFTANATLQIENATPGQVFLESLWVDTNGTGLTISDIYEISVDGTPVGSIGGGVDGGMLAFIFNGNATVADVERIAENVTYRVLVDEPELTRDFEFRVTDGAGGSTSDTITVTVDPENEAPRHRTEMVITQIGSEPVRSLEAIDGPGWAFNRYPGSSLQDMSFGGDTRIAIGIDAGSTNPNLPGYEGFGRDLGDSTKLSIDFYRPADWGTAGTVRTGVWAAVHSEDSILDTTVNPFTGWPLYPTIEYVDAQSDFRIWDAGQWNDLGLPADAALDSWYTISMALDVASSAFVYTVTGPRTGGGTFEVSYTDSTIGDQVSLRDVLLLVRNENDSSFTTLWDNITTNEGDSTSATEWAAAAVSEGATVAIAGLAIADRDGGVLTTTLTTSSGAIDVNSGGSAVVTGIGTGDLSITGSVSEINAALAGFTFTANPDAVGTATITAETVDDGGLSDRDFISVDVAFVNDLPTGADNSVFVEPGRARSIGINDFGFRDLDSGQTLQRVTIDTLPARGTLFLDTVVRNRVIDAGEEVIAGANIAVSDINRGDLIYQAPSGAGTETFSFTVNDGIADAAATNTLTVNVVRSTPQPPNPAPQPEPPPPPPDDLFIGDDQSVIDNQVEIALEPTTDFEDVTVDGALATRGTTSDSRTGEVVQVIVTNPSQDGERKDENPLSPDVDVPVGETVIVSKPEGLGLIATWRETTLQDDLDTIIGPDGEDPDPEDTAGRQAFLDQVLPDDPESPAIELVQVIPARPETISPDEEIAFGITLVGAEPDTGTETVTVIDLANLLGEGGTPTSPITLTIEGNGALVILGAGTFLGGDGDSDPDIDIILGDSSAQVFNFGPGDDVIRGLGGDDRIMSGAGDDQLFGGTGSDTLESGADDDLLVGGAGDDLIHGGPGNDIALFDGPAEAFLVEASVLGVRVTDLRDDGTEGSDLLIGVETLQFDDGSEAIDARAVDVISARGFVTERMGQQPILVAHGEPELIDAPGAQTYDVRLGAALGLKGVDGSNRFLFEAASDDYFIVADGTTFRLIGPQDGGLVLTPDEDTQTLTFSDGSLTLSIDGDRMMLGDQEVLEAFSQITADLDPLL